MAPIPRKTGIDVVGNVPWGTHFCQFYQTKDDLLDILVPYFKTGLESNEFCMWVTCEPLSSEEARDALTEEVNNLDEYIAKGQIEILDYTQWYTKSGRFDAEHVLAGWVEKERQALKNGFEGLRLTGNTFWLEQKDWQDFADYEAEINRVIGNYRMLAICTYSLDRCTPSEIIDVVSNHEFALIRREHNWEIIESAKHTETLEALRESEEKFRNLAEQSPNMIFINKSGRIVYTNERCEKVMGYHREELCSADFDFLTLIAEEHRESTKANFRTHMGGLEVPPFEYTIVTRDGTRIEAILTTKLIQYEGQRAILGIVTDITKHKEAETQLKDSELKLKTIIENAPIGIYLNDLEGKFLYGNENAERIIGRSKDEFIGRSFLELDILGPEGVEKAKILLGLNREGKQTGPDEFILNRKDGAQRTVEVSTVVIDFEGTKAVLGMVRDVTEHRQAEHGLRAQKEFTETALNAQTDTFFVFEAATGKAVRWNEAFKKASGYSHEEIRLMKAPDSYYSQEDLTKARAVTEAILNGAAASVELSLITRDGRSIPTEYTASLIRDNEGSPKYIIAVGRDITERREAEEALRESEERLKEAQRIGGIGDWQFDVEKQEINWSDEVYRLFGRDPAEGPPTYEQNMAYYYPEDSQKLQQQIRRAVEYGDEFDSDYHLKLPSGRSVYQRGVIRVSKDENGRVTKLHGTVQDITERRQAAEALRESEEKYRAIFEQAADSIVLVDGETGRFVDFNNKACENLGYSREEFARLNIADIDVCESEQRVLQHAKKVVTEGADTFETRMRTKGGEIRDVLVNARVISLRGKMFISSVWRDVTEQKKAQEQVESLAKFPSEDPNPVLRISEDCTLVYANEPSAPVLETWQCRVGERLPQTCVERVYQAVNSHKVLTFEFECKNGRIFFVTLAPAADGTYANAYGVDITERKQAEEALRRSERQLQIRNQINSIFLTCADEETYAKVLTLVLETLESKYGTFGYFDDSGQFVVPAMTRDIYWEKCNVPEKDIIFERGQFSGIWGRAVKERKTLYSNSGPFSTPAGHVPIENTMVTPIIYKDELISAIHIANKPGGYDEKDKALLEMMADYIAPVLYARLQTDRHEKERAQAEESLRKSEAALAEAQRIARIGNWEWDVQSGKASWSDEVFSIFGVQPQEPSYELVKALTHPDDTEYWERSVKEALYENKDFKIDYRAVRPDGCVVWIHNEAEIARDERGNPLKMFGTSQDVTERKQAEQALRESEEKFRNLAEQSPNMIFINSGGTIAYANSRCEEAMGYTKEEFYSPGFDFLSIIVPESRDLIRESYRRHLNGEDVAPVEYALATKTGQRIDAILATKLIQYEGEDAILGTVTDITERKRTEEALKLHELRLEALLQLNKMTEASGQDILAFLREEMTEVTQSQVAFVGFISEDESVMSIDNWSKETMAQCAVVGKPMHFPVEKAGLWGEAIRQRKPVIVNDYDAPHPSKRGYPEGHVPVKRFLGIPVFEGERIVAAAGVANKQKDYDESDVRSITSMMNDAWRLISRKKAEAALRESENKYRTLLKNIPQKIFYKDVSLAYVLCNDSFAEDLKIEPEEIRGKTDYNFFPKELAEKYRADDKRILESGNAEEMEEEYVTCGKNTAVHTFKAPLKDEQGNTLGIFGIFWDITDRKQAEEALKRSEERYALAQRAASIGSWDWNIVTGTLSWSDQIEPMFGFGRGEFSATYDAFLECVHPDDRKHVVDSVDDCLHRHKDYAIEHRIVWPDKTVRCVLEKGDVIRDENGQAIRMVGVVQDITERKTAEQRLLLGSKTLEVINRKGRGEDVIGEILQLVKRFTGFDAVGIRLRKGDDFPYFEVDGFPEDFVLAEKYLCVRDEQGRTVYDSQGRPVLECMCGNVILGRTDPAAPFFTESGSFWTNSTTELLKTTSDEDRLTRTRNHCNRAGYESVALIPLRSGAEIVGLLQLNDRRTGCFNSDMIRFFEDISASIGIALARINAEQEIESVARFPSENPCPVLRIADDGTVLYANSAGSELLKDWGCEVGTRAPEHWYQYITRIFQSGLSEKLETTCQDRYFSLIIASVVDAGYVNVYGIDITERKHAEEDLRKHRQHLEELVQERTAELSEANEMLRQEIEGRKRLEKEILNISEREQRRIGRELHDSIGQELTGIAFMTKVLQQKLTKKSLPEAGDVVEIAKLVSQATDQTRSLAKGLHPVDLDRHSLMSALREMAANTARLFGISCTFDCDRLVPVGDSEVAANLYRIAQEAVTNAIRHGEAKNVCIHLTSCRDSSVLTVENDGLDFPVEKADNKGMGLHIMKHRVEMIDGALEIDRRADGGAVVTCTFPNKYVESD